MAGHDEGDDFFSDDGLDNIPQNAFDELEETAIRQTQATQLAQPPPSSSNYGDDFDDEDLDDAEVFDAAQDAPLRGSSVLHHRGHGNSLSDQFGQNRHGGTEDMRSITGRPLKKEWPPMNPPITHRPPPREQQYVRRLPSSDTIPGQPATPVLKESVRTTVQAQYTLESTQIKALQQLRGPNNSLQPARNMILETAAQAGLQKTFGHGIVEAVGSSSNDLALLQAQLAEVRVKHLLTASARC